MPTQKNGARQAQILNMPPVLRLPDFLRQENIPLPSNEEMREIYACLADWAPRLVCLHLDLAAGAPAQKRHKGLLLVYLPAVVERHIAAAWRRSPGLGHLLHTLAQRLCRDAVSLALPEVGAAGCAPLPELSPAEVDMLREAVTGHSPEDSNQGGGLPRLANLGLVYSILTHHPYAGGCECCSLQGICPQMRHS